jgi:hypothetical protein
MKINTAPAHEAIYSNVGEIGEFRIRNSAKAFNILSSGLYANKIRAVVRELSCNAVDSHVAAGCPKTPFDVHLPNAMEPWFAIRDYGVGLSDDQVVNIYTTYFESTKTDSNAYIGALGLGSKSPFSYTDNFTVTAIQNGTKGIYSAFINGDGVPSIAKMMSEQTTEPNGVEIKFSVNEKYDFSKFKSEAAEVYSYFKLQPVVSGANDFKPAEIKYKTRDIIPGVHEIEVGYNRHSIAIMGNIAYPIDVPNAESNLGNLAQFLRCGLLIEFDIGELDFQASREGLSYIPQTISAIKRKLEKINSHLVGFVTDEAEKIDNLWSRAEFLMVKSRSDLWKTAVASYITQAKFPLIVVNTFGLNDAVFTFTVDSLAKDYNINLRFFNRGGSRIKAQISEKNHQPVYNTILNDYQQEVSIHTSSNTVFVESDVKVGSIERMKYHFRNSISKDESINKSIFILLPVDKSKPMKTQAFFKALHNPSRVFKVSTLMEKPRNSVNRARDVTVMKLCRRGGYKRNCSDLVWHNVGKADSFSDTETYYYFPLKGFGIISDNTKNETASSIVDLMKASNLPELNIDVYGVRKGDLDFIKTKSNWINVETHLVSTLTNMNTVNIDGLVKSVLDQFELLKYNKNIYSAITNKNGKYMELVARYKDTVRLEFSQSLIQLMKLYAPEVAEKISNKFTDLKNECRAVYDHYPMFELVSTGYNFDRRADYQAKVAQYINLIDSSNAQPEEI